jgi:hypothetical protein
VLIAAAGDGHRAPMVNAKKATTKNRLIMISIPYLSSKRWI